MTRDTLDDRTAIVTGASAGVGRATAKALAREGANVVLAARREERLQEVADEIASNGGTAVGMPTDVSEETEVEALVKGTVEEFGSLEIVVNNAGIGRGNRVMEMSTEQYRDMISVNVDGFFFMTRAALPYLLDTSGNLIFVGSFAGQYPRSFNPVYAATKWFDRGFAKSIMAQLGNEDIAVSIVNPSEVRTEFGHQDGEPFKDRFEKGEVSEPEEMAEGIVFAAKQDEATISEMDVYRRNKFDIF